METNLTIDYDKQWLNSLNCVSAIGPIGKENLVVCAGSGA